MGSTSNRSYPYPDSTDNFRPSEDIQALADAIDEDRGTGQLLTSTTLVACSADKTLGTGEAVVTGMSTTITTHVDTAVVKVIGTLQFTATTGATSNLQGRLYADTAQQIGTINENLPNTGDVRTSTSMWTITGLSVGTHTIEMRCAKSNGNGTHVANATNSRMDVSVYE